MKNSEQGIALYQYLRSIITNIPFGIITLGKDLDVVMLNDISLDLLGLDSENPSDFIDISYKNIFQTIPIIQEKFEQEILIQKNRKFDIQKFQFNKHTLNIKCRTTLYGTLFIIEDMTLQAHIEDELQYQAEHDPLTNLINRKQLEKKLHIFNNKWSQNFSVGAVVFIDLDRFKPVNDVAGHSAGDALLKEVTAIMSRIIREKDTLARVGGDEFIIFLEDCPLERAISITEKIRQEIDEFIFEWKDNIFSIGISAGISLITAKLKDIEEAINLADQACLIAKEEGRNRIHIADSSIQNTTAHKKEISWITTINEAIKKDKFVLFAQKIENIQDKAYKTHYEILLRLEDKQGNYLKPAAFMPSAERYELMLKLDEWVLLNAFKFLQKNHYYSINLSGQTMSNLDIIDLIIKLEKEYNVNPKKITFEITETMAIKYFKNTQKIIDKLIKRGYKFSLDDFGTGLSSYEYLKKMSVSYLKIDGVFIKEIINDKVSCAMVKSINDIGKVMGLQTIAEFVEEKAVLEKLKELGVDYAQGYYIHEPELLSKI